MNRFNAFPGLTRLAIAWRLFLAVGLLLVSVLAHAQTEGNAPGLPFNHATTGFMLVGSHISVNCESCHTQGLFKGTPRDCASCHRPGGRATGKPIVHIPTQAACESCHRTTAWTPTTFRHTAQMAGQCSSCHSGAYAAAGAFSKPLTHVNTNASCDSCHSTSAWLPAANSHANVIPGSCVNCHNGSKATGKNAAHIPVTGACDSCHTNFTAFAPARMDHTGLSACSTCHSGTFPKASSKPVATHIPTANQCSDCHTSTTTWVGGVNFAHPLNAPGNCLSCHATGAPGSAKKMPDTHLPIAAMQCDACHSNYGSFVGSRVIHNTLVGIPCVSCHDGAHAAQNARGKSGSHITTSLSCDTCHVTNAWVPASGFSHQGVTAGTCASSCHGGGSPSATTKPVTHIPDNGACDNCHKNYVAFAPAKMSHAALTTPLCSTCHSGSYTSVNAQTKASGGTHNPGNQTCNTCHQSTTSWSTNVNYVHGPSSTDCATCHSGAISGTVGKPVGSHIPTTGQCSDCHTNTVAFRPAQMFHSTSTVGQCLTCHNGNFKFVNALAKPASHIPDGGVQCDACHAQTAATFAPATMNHSAVSSVACASCHGGSYTAVNAQAKSISHMTPATQDCGSSGCHASTTTWAKPTWDHTGVTVGSCVTCHDGRTVKAPSRPTSHIPISGTLCDDCHINYSAFKPALMSHASVSDKTCDTCHSGAYTQVNALGKRTGHVPTTANCVTCHTAGFTTWVGARMNHDAAVVGKCSTCHSGGFLAVNAQSKTPTHIATTAQCDTCHKSTSTWATGSFTHTVSVAGQCTTCHNGRNALGKPTNHIPTNAQCDSCHTSFTGFRPASMNHTGLTGQCSTCHNGSYNYVNALGQSANHIPTTATCDTCHQGGYTSWKPASMSHAGFVNNCSSCHSGAYLAQNAQIKPVTHVSTTAQCDTCHKSTTSWATVTYTHSAGAAGTCNTCHNGVNALGKPTTHIPTSTQCDSCHTNFAGFKPASMNHTGLAAQCSTCHSGAYNYVNALGKPLTHVATTASCDTCHLSTLSWAKPTYSHDAGATGNCSNCHNGTVGLGKTSKHIPTSAQCDTCHKNFGSFVPASMSHVGTAGACATCHSGVYSVAVGKSANHVPTTASCDNCHWSTASWAKPTYSHDSAASGNCSTCHNGTLALGKSAQHVPTAAQCDTCHKNFSTFSPASMSHAGTTGLCATCHTGTFSAGAGKPNTHIPTSASCDTCHLTTAWKPASNFSHAGLTDCATCHNGTQARGKSASHIPSGSVQCSSCHATGTSFTPATMNHALIDQSQCASCHNGSYLNVNAQAKPPTHVSTSNNCLGSGCHTSTSTWVSVTGYLHSPSAVNNCASCHNGTVRGALSKPTNHIPTTAQCDSCHQNYTAFTAAVMNHAGTATQCSTCHNGSYVYANALAKTVKHVVTSAQCDTCHRSTVTWTAAQYVHEVTAAGNCATCHAGSSPVGLAKPSTHIPTTGSANCDSCHTNYSAFAPARMNHSGLSDSCATCHGKGAAYLAVNAQQYSANHFTTAVACNQCHVNGFTNWTPSVMNHSVVSASRCDSCHNGQYTSMNAQSRSANHIPITLAGADCVTCHSATGVTWATKPKPDHTSYVRNCDTCHTGLASSPAIGKPNTHIPTTMQCDSCHSTAAFLPAKTDHTGTAGNCVSCHGGAYVGVGAKTKPATHIPTALSCDTCHTTTLWKPASNFSHQGVAAGTCATCHNGTNALGKATSHIPVSTSCDSCHKNYVAFAPAKMDHTGLGGQCASCHSGAYLTINAQNKPLTHVTTALQCDTCHSSTTTWATATFVHSAGDTACSTCHNGAKALGKPTNHLPVSPTPECSTCHQNKVAFKPAQMNHTGFANNCSSCHNGNYVFTNALAKPVTHIPVSTQCDTCHTNTTRWSPSQMNHTGLTAPTACATCHNGAYLAQNAQSKPAGHVVSSSVDCVTGCHTQALSTASWALNTKPDHTSLTNCVSCHDGQPLHAIGKPTNHVPADSNCALCHSKTAPNFTLSVMTHSLATVGTGKCATCHNGSYTFTGAQTKPSTHIPTTQSCDVCHAYSQWKPTSFSHAGVAAGTCTTCHNGTNAAGKSTPHIPTTQSCDACHRTSAWMPLVTPYAHTGVTAGACSTCHVSSFPSMDIKPSNHVPTTASCDACHSKTAWLPLLPVINHTGMTSCQSCHVLPYTSIRVKPNNHIPVTVPGLISECSSCHTGTTSFLVTRWNHNNLGTTLQCTSCHLTGMSWSVSVQKKSLTHQSTKDKNGAAVTDCDSAGCHKPATSGRGTLWSSWD